MKTCNNCKELKNVSEFNKDKSKKDGLHTFCKNCRRKKNREYAAKNREAAQKRAKEWYANNKERANKSSKKWREANKEKMKAYKDKWNRENKEHKKKLSRKWKKENSHKVLAATRARQAAKLKATPAWANKEAIDFVYYAAKTIEKVYGTKWHVDHIIPLRGKTVCGLHVENNLQLLTPKQNLSKSNSISDSRRTLCHV